MNTGERPDRCDARCGPPDAGLLSTLKPAAACENSDRLFALEQVTAARTLLPSVERELLEIAAVLAGATDAQARQVLSRAGAQAALMAAGLMLDCGDARTAGRYLDTVMAAARAAEDGSLWAYCATHAQGAGGAGPARRPSAHGPVG